MNLFDCLDDLLAIDPEPRPWPDDPEPSATEILAEIEDLVTDARRSAARAVAAERRLARELERARAALGACEKLAHTACDAARPDLARRAALRQAVLEGWVTELDAEHAAARRVRETVLDCLALLEARLVRTRAPRT